MKKLFVLFMLLSLCSCSNSLQEFSESENLMDNMQTRSANSHYVSIEDIKALVNVQENTTRNGCDKAYNISCIEDETHDTLLYVCENVDSGWTIYSSDTRVPAVVAQSSTGTYSDIKQNDNAFAWLMTIAEDMKVIKNLPDDRLNFTGEEIERNKEFWKSISDPDNYVKEKLAEDKTRTITPPPLVSGHYVFRATKTYTEIYDSIPRLTTTNWHQDSNYNMYCPYKSDNSGERAPAGCVAIAGAQMLYFLHNHFGVPETAPSEAYCYGYVNTNYNWAQTSYNSTIWNTMNVYSSDAAPLIADVGRRVGMSYGNDGSGAQTSDLVDDVFAPYGISCTYSTYDKDELKTELQNGIPVILSARTTEAGHAFIADRYRRERTVTKHCYEWEYDFFPPGVPLPYIPPMEEFEYSTPTICEIGMNWGWGSEYNNENEWYALTDDWIKGKYNFNQSRAMIYNFHVLND